MSKSIKIIDGDATRPIGTGFKLIAHCCNDINCWGSGFVISLSKRWSKPEAHYHDCGMKGLLKLGKTFIVPVEKDIAIANMIGQEGVGIKSTPTLVKGKIINKLVPPIRYVALQECFNSIVSRNKIGTKLSIHVPYKMGADRAGGDWNKIVEMLENTFCKNGINVTAYKWNGDVT